MNYSANLLALSFILPLLSDVCGKFQQLPIFSFSTSLHVVVILFNSIAHAGRPPRLISSIHPYIYIDRSFHLANSRKISPPCPPAPGPSAPLAPPGAFWLVGPVGNGGIQAILQVVLDLCSAIYLRLSARLVANEAHFVCFRSVHYVHKITNNVATMCTMCTN